MGAEYTFYDYIDADGDGGNLINNWLNGGGKPAKARYIIVIGNLEASPPRGFTDTVWKHPYVIDLHGEWQSYIEIRVKKDKNQYRLIGKKLDRDVLLVTWGYHDGRGWYTDITPETADIRIDRMIKNPLRYRRKHEF